MLNCLSVYFCSSKYMWEIYLHIANEESVCICIYIDHVNEELPTLKMNVNICSMVTIWMSAMLLWSSWVSRARPIHHVKVSDLSCLKWPLKMFEKLSIKSFFRVVQACTFWVTQTHKKFWKTEIECQYCCRLTTKMKPWTLTMTVKWHYIDARERVSIFILYSYIFTAWESAIFGDGVQSYSGSPSPPLSDDGNVSSSSSVSSNDQKYIIKQNHHKLKINQLNGMKIHIRRGQRTTSLSASDEGIVMDYGEEVTRKKKVSQFNLI